ncbi:hypothetical protein [Streptomyces sp. NPDC088178]|uniref:hypothetical protein n=1 Tax=Streptomyces sp. NPDC088178 TaxID=3365836 RepID=UPI0037F15F28
MSRSIKWLCWKSNSMYEHSRKCRLSSGVVARASAAAVPVRATAGTRRSVLASPSPRDYRSSHAGNDPAALFAERVAEYRATVIRTTEEGGRRRFSHP